MTSKEQKDLEAFTASFEQQSRLLAEQVYSLSVNVVVTRHQVGAIELLNRRRNAVIRPAAGTLSSSGAPPVIVARRVLPATSPPIPVPWLAGMLSWLCPSKFYKRVLEPTIADMNAEYADALAAGQTGRAKWLVFCAVVSIGKALFLKLGVPAIALYRAVRTIFNFFG
jgi:hypothetical protein